MPIWTNYDSKNTADSDDTFLIADSTGKNKPVRQLTFSALWAAIRAKLPSASTTAAGIVKLSNAINNDSTETAATSKAVKDVSNKVDELSAVRTATVQLTNFTWETGLQRAGRTVRISNSADCTKLAAGGWTTIGTIPQGYRPITQCRFAVTTFDPNLSVQMILNTDGTIQVYNYSAAITAAKTFIFDACWITNDD